MQNKKKQEGLGLGIVLGLGGLGLGLGGIGIGLGGLGLGIGKGLVVSVLFFLRNTPSPSKKKSGTIV